MNERTIIDDGADVLDPRKVLAEQTLAVDLERVQLDQAIATAHRFPRHIDVVYKKIVTLACYNKDSAENCIYALPRGGKPIIGPSIGFASIVAQCWGNCKVAAQITYIDRKEKVVVAAGRFFDLESNTETVVPVNRRITDRQGRLYNDDMIQVTGAAAASIAARNAVLRGVSRGIWHPIFLEALQIVRGTIETFAETKAKALAAMAQFGVAPDKVFMFLGLKGEIEMTLEHIPTLRGMYATLRDGSMTVEEMFDPRRMTGRGFEQVDNPLGGDGVTEGQAPSAGTGGGDDDGGDGQAPGAATSSGPRAHPQGAAQQSAPKQETVAPAQQPDTASKASESASGPTAKAETAPRAENAQASGPASPDTSPAQPKNAAEYVAHWKQFCASAMSPAAIKQRYASERNLRKTCEPFTTEQFEQLDAIRDARVAEFGK